MKCTICGSKQFKPFRGRALAKCSQCHSLERHRYAYDIIKQLKYKSVLHFAPEGCLGKLFSGVSYTKVDLVPKPKLGIKKCNILKTGFPDNSFDLIVCSHVLEHVVDVFVALQELKRISKGKILILVPLKPGRTYRNPFAKTDRARTFHHGQKNHEWYFGQDDFHLILQSAGLKVQTLKNGQYAYLCS